jgi:hypothetical protein
MEGRANRGKKTCEENEATGRKTQFASTHIT